MALSIRRGTSKILRISIENCTSQDYLWGDFKTVIVRISQGNTIIDKTPVIDSEDATSCFVYYSQEDTIKLSEKAKAKLQILLIKESGYHQLVIKTSVFDILILESLWNNTVDGTSYAGEEFLNLDRPEYTKAVGHDYYGYLHIDIKEFNGVITEVDGAIMTGNILAYDQSSETLLSDSL